MIDNASLEREWIMKLRNERFPKRDPGIIEKAIYALTLLERLSERQLHFVFKGGTSLILVLDEFRFFVTDSLFNITFISEVWSGILLHQSGTIRIPFCVEIKGNGGDYSDHARQSMEDA
ncbi:MAG: hypothetical protein PWQ24_726 [Mesotoga sp.]|nr:hypothetical protein [Mesotoga sp.]